MDGLVDVVRGRRVEAVPAAWVREWTRPFNRAAVDVGTGDGRWLYRRARMQPETAWIGIDANADRMRAVAFRAGRKPARGGIRNLLLIRASIEALPQALDGVADEVYVLYPWGSLLEAVWTPRPAGLSAVRRLARAGARIEVQVNASAVPGDGAAGAARAAGYAAAGIRLQDVRVEARAAGTSWGRRISHGRGASVFVLRGIIE